MTAWAVPNTRIQLTRPAGTPQAADLSAALKRTNPDFVILAQGNHHPDARMSQTLRTMFTYLSAPDPVYKNAPGGPGKATAAVAAWEHRFTGAPASPENTLIIKQQGRYALEKGVFALKTFMKGADSDAVLVPNLRWRVVDNIMIDADRTMVDYDNTDTDIVNAVADAVKRAGGPEKVGMLYLCSPNNPTGRRYTQNEYQGLRHLCDDINKARQISGKPPMVAFFDDPYFEAHYMNHNDLRRATAGEPYLNTGYKGFFGNDHHGQEPSTPALILHSQSKFLEQAGSNGMTFAVCTSQQFQKIYATKLTTGGALSYNHNFMDVVAGAFQEDNDPVMLDRCIEAANLFYANSKTLKNAMGASVLKGESNMVMCVTVPKASYVGCEVAYPDGERVMLKDSADLVETIANFGGVGLVPERNDKQTPAKGYNPETHDLVRIALNDPNRFEEGVRRMQEALAKIELSLKSGVSLHAGTQLPVHIVPHETFLPFAPAANGNGNHTTTVANGHGRNGHGDTHLVLTHSGQRQPSHG